MAKKTTKEQGLASLRERMRHSASHVMAEAVLSIFPEAKLAIGPAIEDGFYYDFLLLRALTPEDLEAIEKRMRESVKGNYPFVQSQLDKASALREFAQQPFKLELIQGIADEKVSIYQHHSFRDLCAGPHVERTGDIKAFKLLSIAGAYWRGDEHNPMLQRIYGTAYESQQALDDYLHMLEEAAKRDHRKLGRELELFMFDPIAPASPFFFPKGTVVYNLLVEYVRGLYKRYGYQEVITPQIFSTDLWKRSGHYDNYIDSMFFVEMEGREFGVKPMNCPGHALMYASQLRSYRELPIRYADFGRVHRYERSGVTHGLTRARTFAQDDAHIFCRPDQVQSEVDGFIDMLMEAYPVLGFHEVRLRLSRRPEKRVGSDEMWDRAEAALEDVLEAKEIEYDDLPGEGAFYGPKIDFFVPDALGREWQLGTVQVDFSMPERFGLEYVTERGSIERPVMIHRAMLGSIERFLGVLIEHIAGAFPVWLAPVQVVIIPIADRHLEYARKVEQGLLQESFRVQVDARSERMNLKIREAQLQKVPYMVIIGDEEVKSDSLTVRLRSGENLKAQPIQQFKTLVVGAIAARS